MMLQTIEGLAKKRRNWVDANRENGFEAGIKRLLTELYPDNAHFVYELLQNAEDAYAKEVRFILNEDRIEFEHDGVKPFSFRDVESITSLGSSTKREDATNIGKFGVGFKAVFAYTDTPEISSSEFNFKILDMVVPEKINKKKLCLNIAQTRFILPFNNPKKTPPQAKNEIENLLKALDADTLIFLNHIQKIEYLLPDSSLGYIERVDLGENKFEIRVQSPHEIMATSSFFLKFDKHVVVDDEEEDIKGINCRIAIAFKIELVNKKNKTNKQDDASAVVESEWTIVPITPGSVCIYFPAEKETSNLRFHIHAPFASTVARDSVRNCGGNNILRDNLADLLAESMHKIRDYGLLSVNFLSLLPNDKDNLKFFYKKMMDRLVREFQNENLVPMKQGGHAAARGIFRGTKALSGLITDEDFSMLLGEDYFPPMWVANPPQRNQREDNFLSMLEIEQWTIDDFVSSLSELDPNTRQAWMSGKSDEWHQDLYEQMYDHINIGSRKSTESIRIQSILNQIEIVKCSDGIYRSGKMCYFPVKDVYYDEILPRVSSGVYQYGGDDGTKSYEFLKFIGVQHVDRIIEIKGILQYRYSKESIDLYAKNIELAEIKIFIEFVNENPQYSDIFENYYIFKLKNDHWGTPNHLYLDAPYMDTELSAWYALQDVVDDKQPLSDQYKSLDLSPKIIGDFAQSVGAQSKLIISEQRAHQNPNWEYLSRNGGSQFTGTGVDVDYHIPNLLEFLENPSITKAALIWKTMNEMCEKHYSCKYLNARFGRNRSNINESPSTLIYDLCHAAWVPQVFDDQTEFVIPRYAFVDKLPPDNFLYETGMQWLKSIEFGRGNDARISLENNENEKRKYEYLSQLLDDNKKNVIAKEFGFKSQDEAKEVAELINGDPDGYIKWKSGYNKVSIFPTRTVTNPERRQIKLGEQLAVAPQKEYEKRERRVRTSRRTIDPTTYLRENYTDMDQMVCQICKDEMPFRKRDGTHYFEKIEILTRNFLPKEHESQFLALCPLCSAMYNEFVLNDEDVMMEIQKLILTSEKYEIPLVLGSKLTSIKFVEVHFYDLKTIIFSLQE